MAPVQQICVCWPYNVVCPPWLSVDISRSTPTLFWGSPPGSPAPPPPSLFSPLPCLSRPSTCLFPASNTSMAGETSIQDAHMKENLLKYAVPASIVSAGLYSFVLSHCWYGICDKRKEQEKEDEEAPRNEPAVTVVCSLLEAVCLYHLSRATPGKKEGVMTTWMEVSVLGTLLLVSSHLMQNSIASLRPPGGLQLYHVGFDVARITGSSALLLGIEHALADLSDAPAPSAGHA